MQSLKGKLRDIEDLRLLVLGLEKKAGRLTLSLPYFGDEVSICCDGKTWRLNSGFRDFQVFLEKWKVSSVRPSFTMSKGDCEGAEVSKEEILNLLSNSYLDRLRLLPESFLIEKISLGEVPSCLVSLWKLERPVSRWDVYRCGLTLIEFVELLEKGLLEIKPFKLRESLPWWLRLILNSLLVAGFVVLVFPVDILKLSTFEYAKAINWGLRELVLDREKKLPLPVRGCLDSSFVLNGNKVVFKSELKGYLIKKEVLKLPKKGFKPMFCLPEK